ncbi:MAG: type II toxin-antitoxin system VapC family toxin [Chloroflexi bacterium]|nr:type II toxin-antitoxin system VapC family toxin [Chloroflexota bacterium]
MILCDTNILIEFYRNNQEVVANLQDVGLAELAVSMITVGELYFGARDRQELQIMKKHLAKLKQISVDADVSEIAVSLLETYTLSHRLSLPDALIAATALHHGLSLYTINIRDFRFIEGLSLYNK